jgi:hypothetical protein
MAKIDIPGSILRSLDAGRDRQLRGEMVAIPIGWLIAVVALVTQARNWKVACIEILVGLVPFAIGGFIWWRHRVSAQEEARRVRSPLNLS